jgi:hypothetical protein
MGPETTCTGEEIKTPAGTVKVARDEAGGGHRRLYRGVISMRRKVRSGRKCGEFRRRMSDVWALQIVKELSGLSTFETRPLCRPSSRRLGEAGKRRK